MSRIKNAFQNGKAFIPFITAGDPDIETTEQLIYKMEEAGADLIELGVPFSDPIAEGEVIQEANIRALLAGCTVDKLFDMMSRVRRKTEVPIVYLTYANPIYVYGTERFIKRCKETGIDGLIVPDLPFEEREEFLPFCTRYDVDLISLITPTSKERICMIAKEAKGFIYCVSSLGVTGVRSEIRTDISTMTKLVRQTAKVPCAVGFGVSRPEQAAELARSADGVIVGSAIVKIVAAHGRESLEPVYQYVKEMKDSIR